MSRVTELISELVYQYPTGITTHAPCAACCACAGVVGVVECPAKEPQWTKPINTEQS